MAKFHRIKELSATRGISLAHIAKQADLTPVGLTILIREGRTTTQTIERIAKVLQVPVGYFFDDDVALDKTNEAPLQNDIMQVVREKDAIIEQKDKIIEQKDEIIHLLTTTKK